eukprot:8932945-Alexandrium_andersonii.AAC.1
MLPSVRWAESHQSIQALLWWILPIVRQAGPHRSIAVPRSGSIVQLLQWHAGIAKRQSGVLSDGAT